MRFQGLHRVQPLRLFSNVERKWQGAPARLLDGGSYRRRALDVGHPDPGALDREPPRDSRADSPSRTRDQGYLFCQTHTPLH